MVVLGSSGGDLLFFLRVPLRVGLSCTEPVVSAVRLQSLTWFSRTLVDFCGAPASMTLRADHTKGFLLHVLATGLIWALFPSQS